MLYREVTQARKDEIRQYMIHNDILDGCVWVLLGLILGITMLLMWVYEIGVRWLRALRGRVRKDRREPDKNRIAW